MLERRVSRLPVGWKHGCDGRDCPLRSAIVTPIVNRNDAIGAIVLFSENALAVSDRDRVIARQLDGAPHETLLTIDATTGQNGLRQARRRLMSVESS